METRSTAHSTRTGHTLCIIGAGGFGREVLCLYEDCRRFGQDIEQRVIFAEDDAFFSERTVRGVPVQRLSLVDASTHRFVIAIGNCAARRRIAEDYPGLAYTSLVHPSAIMGHAVAVSEGSIVCAGVILTTDIRLGRHAHLNLATTIGHDFVCGDFFTAAPGVRISGRCTVGACVQLGTGAMLRENISIADDVVVGMGAAVVSNLTAAGTYVGVPARRLR